MENNIIIDTANWVKGKDYPEWLDEVGIAKFLKDTFFLMKLLAKLIDV